jgi:hypothetical protein
MKSIAAHNEDPAVRAPMARMLSATACNPVFDYGV